MNTRHTIAVVKQLNVRQNFTGCVAEAVGAAVVEVETVGAADEGGDAGGDGASGAGGAVGGSLVGVEDRTPME